MNKVKATFWVIVLGFILLIFFQNQNFFLAKQSIHINLVFVKYQIPAMPTAILFFAFFIAGLIISYFLNIFERFRFRKMIKILNATVESQRKEILTSTNHAGPLPTDSAVSKEDLSTGVT